MLAAVSADDIEPLLGPQTRRLVLAPDEVAIPGLTDSHLHLVDAALALERIDLSTAATLQEGLARVADAHARSSDPSAWLEGHGWDANRWGAWPTASALEGVAPGRRAAFWQHDHHALWVSEAGLAAAGVTAATADPAGGFVRRLEDGAPEGCLQESASAHVTAHIPAPSTDEIERLVPKLGRELIALAAVQMPALPGSAQNPG